MSNVFISYSAQSRDAVKALAQDIRALEHRVWYDQELLGGHAWWDRILTEIRNCDVFVFALSGEALDSIPCRLEYTYAFALGKPILPVIVADGVSAELLPPALSAVQHVDYRASDKRAAFGLVKALNALPPTPALPDPLPPAPALPGAFLGALKQQIEEAETLTFREQSELAVKLKDRLRDPAQASEVRKLLLRLRQRDDLYAKVADEIDAVLGGRERGEEESAPPRDAAIDKERAPRPEPSRPAHRRAGRLAALVIAAAIGFVLAMIATNGRDEGWILWPVISVGLLLAYGMVCWLLRLVFRPWRSSRTDA